MKAISKSVTIYFKIEDVKFYFGIQSRRLTLWKQYLLSIALTMGTSSTIQVVVWIILLYNTKKVNYIGHQISTPYVVPIPLRMNQFIAKDSPKLDLTDHFIKYNTAIQERKRKKLCFMSKQHSFATFHYGKSPPAPPHKRPTQPSAGSTGAIHISSILGKNLATSTLLPIAWQARL
jgi:hypothetical protein